MSKVGDKVIPVEQGVTVEVSGHSVRVVGQHGDLKFDFPPALRIEVKDTVVKITRNLEDRKTRALHGLHRSLLANAITGVQKPWEKKLEIVGTGFNARLQGEDLIFKVGYSHPVIFPKVAGITFRVEDSNVVVVSGVDKHMVGEIAYQIKKIKKPDVYKGKGIKYAGERLRIKPGKKAKAAGAA